MSEAEESQRPSRSSHAERFVVLKAQGRRLIVQVPRVLEVIPQGSLEIEGLPPLLRGRSSPAINALSKLDHELILLLSLARLVPQGWLAAADDLSAASQGKRKGKKYESNGDPDEAAQDRAAHETTAQERTAQEATARQEARGQQEGPPPKGGRR